MTNRIYARHVQAYVFRVVVKRPIPWGQSPGLVGVLQTALDQDRLDILEDNLAHPDPVLGFLQPGDRVRFLLANLEEWEGSMNTRVEVRPVDGRKVGNSMNRVWIGWPGDGRRVRGLFRIVGE